ncbi:MAG: hypothetical protein HC847_04100 [Hydrococcus sp. RU_2_2]|nr:hypothetical protein [Hydrococcus sp. RU_2_2]NJP20083.1 hypothetical protein [Hydrococcus sp. CRU_1_1]
MTSKPTNTNTESDVSDRVSSSEEELISTEQAIATETHEVRIELPQPDAENITVLTDKLPNKPILPWNRYDSPWEESESEPEATEEFSQTGDLANDETKSDEVK